VTTVAGVNNKDGTRHNMKTNVENNILRFVGAGIKATILTKFVVFKFKYPLSIFSNV
jgi:hypothetical protein